MPAAFAISPSAASWPRAGRAPGLEKMCGRMSGTSGKECSGPRYIRNGDWNLSFSIVTAVTASGVPTARRLPSQSVDGAVDVRSGPLLRGSWRLPPDLHLITERYQAKCSIQLLDVPNFGFRNHSGRRPTMCTPVNVDVVIGPACILASASDGRIRCDCIKQASLQNPRINPNLVRIRMP
jgi:hypothetical protein